MKSALPLLVAGGAALLLMGGKKKKTKSASFSDEVEVLEEDRMDSIDEEIDEGSGPDSNEDEGYGKVAAGTRKDRLGGHGWRITYEEDGYHALLMTSPGKFSPVDMELGVAASLKAAKELLRDHYNQAILDAGFSEADFYDDPAAPATTRVNSLKMA